MFTYRISETLALRQLEPADGVALLALLEASREALRAWIDERWLPTSPAQTQVFLEDSVAQYEGLGVIDAGLWQAGRLIGVAALTHLDRRRREAELGYWLGPAFQGQGLMTSAVRALADFAFTDYQLKRLTIQCAVPNLRSRALAERLAFRLERIQPGGDEVNGRVNDLAIYGMFDYRWRGEPHPLVANHRARRGLAGGEAPSS